MAADTPMAWAIFNQLAPAAPEIGGGPRCVQMALDFTAIQAIDVNMTLENMLAELQFVQTLYIDNMANAAFLDIFSLQTQQRLRIPANSQAYLPILSAAPNFRFATTGALIVPVHFINVPMPAIMWTIAP